MPQTDDPAQADLSTGDRRLTPSLTPIRDSEFTPTHARHLLWRAGFGGSPEQISALTAMGARGAVDFLIDTASTAADDPGADEFDPDIMRPLTDTERARYRRARQAQDEDTLAEFRMRRQQAQRADRGQMRDLQRWWLRRMIETPNPLEEKLVLLWHGHFVTSYRTIENSWHMYRQNQLFRRHAIGNFGALLGLIIRDPAMLAYLDNNDSSARQPNENLARELLELFGLGEGAYSERDIKEGARALTGYTFRDDEFYFNRRNHDDGVKTILGVRGPLDGEGFVKAILAQRACSEFVAFKLYDHFVLHLKGGIYDDDRAVRSVVARMADDLRDSGYDLKPVLRRLFLSRHFYDAAVMGERVKSPVELVVGAVRTLNAPARDLDILLEALDLMGQSLFMPPSVKGWDGGRAWINTSTLFVRQNLMSYLLAGKLPRGYDASAETLAYDPWPVVKPLAEIDPDALNDPERAARHLLEYAVNRVPEDALAVLLGYFAERGDRVTPETVAGALLLITAMPEYQLC